MNVKTLTSDLSVAGQISSEDIAEIVARGFRSIVCNRPDGEEPAQPGFAEIADAAQRAGLFIRNVPVAPSDIGESDAALFAAALDDLPKPVLAYCRSGARSTALWTLSQKIKDTAKATR